MVLLHKHTLTHRRFDTQKPLHTNAFTHKSFYTQKLLHTKAFTQRRFYTQTLLHTDAFTRRCFLHTLAQKYLIELLMWNASNVQETPHLSLTGGIWRTLGGNHFEVNFLRPCPKVQKVLMQLFQIAKTVQLFGFEYSEKSTCRYLA